MAVKNVTDIKQTLADYDAVHKRFRNATGPQASAEIAELIELGNRAITTLRNEPSVLPPRTITLYRQRLVTNKISVDQNNLRRVSFLMNSAIEDNDHNPFEDWNVVSCDIVFRGEPEVWGGSTVQKVTALVTESRVARLGE